VPLTVCVQGTSHLLPCGKRGACSAGMPGAGGSIPSRAEQATAAEPAVGSYALPWTLLLHPGLCYLLRSNLPVTKGNGRGRSKGSAGTVGTRGAPSPPELLGNPAALLCLGFLPLVRNSFCTCQVTKVNCFCLSRFTLLWVQFQSGIFRAYHMPFINVSVPAQRLGGERDAASLLRLTRTQALHNLQTAKGTALSLASKGCILTLRQSLSWCKKNNNQPTCWILTHSEASICAISVAARADTSSKNGIWTAIVVIPPHTHALSLAVDTGWFTQLPQGKPPRIYPRERTCPRVVTTNQPPCYKSRLQLCLTVSFQQTLKRRRVSKTSSFGLSGACNDQTTAKTTSTETRKYHEAKEQADYDVPWTDVGQIHNETPSLLQDQLKKSTHFNLVDSP